jgi:hypothetical protein
MEEKDIIELNMIYGEIVDRDVSLPVNEKHYQYKYEYNILNVSLHDIFIVNAIGTIVKLPSLHGKLKVDTQNRNSSETIQLNDFDSSIIIFHRLDTNARANNQKLKIEWLSGVEDERINKIKKNILNDDNLEWKEIIDIVNGRTILKNGFHIPDINVNIFFREDMARSFGHFKSRQQAINKMIVDARDITNNSLNVTIKLVCKNKTIGNRYTVFHNEVVLLKPITGNTVLEDGVYLSGLLLKDGKSSSTDIDSLVYYTFEQLEKEDTKIKLFKTEIEALNWRDKNDTTVKELEEKNRLAVLNQEIMRKEKEYKDAELNFKKNNMELSSMISNMEAEIKARNLEAETKIKELTREYEREKDQLERERLRIEQDGYRSKHSYERAHDDNKMLTEGIKTVGLLAAGILAAKTLLK